jgi:hypothetical protein
MDTRPERIKARKRGVAEETGGEEFQKENEWLKKELAYGEHQGEVGY